MTEQWKDVSGFEGFYAVSNLGNMKSLARTVCREGGKARTLPERAMRCANTTNGYRHVSLRKPGEKQVKRLVHRLVAIAFLGLGPDDEVNHKDGDKTNNIYTNLESCTHAENMAHAWDNDYFLPRKRTATA
jgi:hypothetical protein